MPRSGADLVQPEVFMTTHTVIIEQTTARSELERIAQEARVFISMPEASGITPPVLMERGERELAASSEGRDRWCGVFRPGEIGLSVFDHGALYGDAVFEGVLIVRNRLFQWREHLQRLYNSAAGIQIQIPYSPAQLTAHILAAVAQAGIGDESPAYIRLVVTRGLGDLGIHPAKCLGSTVYAIVAKIQLYPEPLYERGIKTSVSRHIRRASADVLDPGIKSCNYLNNILALVDTRDQLTDETLMLARDGSIAEATADNLFLVRRENGWEDDPSKVQVFTPSSSYCLRGITRDLVLGHARDLGFEVMESEKIIPADLVGTSREVFLTGTAAGIIPVISVDGNSVGDGFPGPITRKLRHLLLQDMADPAKGLWIFANSNEIRQYLNEQDFVTATPALKTPISLTEEFVLSLFHQIDGRNWEALSQFFCSDVVYERPGYEPLRGFERLMKFYKEERVIRCGEHLLENIVLDERRGACWGRFVGTHKNGSLINERFADAYTFKDGKIHTRRSFFFRPAV